MKKNNRWMKWVVSESAKTEVVMPWERKAKLARSASKPVTMTAAKSA